MESKTVVYTPEAGGGNSGMMAMLAPSVAAERY